MFASRCCQLQSPGAADRKKQRRGEGEEERERKRESPKGIAKSRQWPEEKFCARARARGYNCIFARDAIDRSIGQSAKSCAFPRARTREERREDGAYLRSASLDETKIMAQPIGSDHAWSLSGDFYYFIIYAPRSEFHWRTALSSPRRRRELFSDRMVCLLSI